MGKIQEYTFNKKGEVIGTPRPIAEVEISEDYGVILVLHGHQVLTSSHGGGWGMPLSLDTAIELGEEILRTVAQAEAAAEAHAQAEYNRVMESLDGFDY